MREVIREVSAGGLVLREAENGAEVLLIRIRKEGLEIPKGHVEAGETLEAAAAREILEETGLNSTLRSIASLGKTEHRFDQGHQSIIKEVHYFLFKSADAELHFGPRPKATRELVWLHANHPRLAEVKYPNLLGIIDQAWTQR